MALKLIYGNFLTGEINETNVLPVAEAGSSFVKDINAQDRLTFSISKNKLGVADWGTIISEAATMVALVDTSKPWDSPESVLGGGFVNKVSGKVGDVITIQVMGLREYLAALICNPKLSGTYTNPNSGIVFGGTTWRGVIAHIITYLAAIPRTPAVFGPIDGSEEIEVNEGTASRPVLFTDGEIFANLLDSVRDVESPTGTEYLFPLRWTSAEKNRMHFLTVVGTASSPKINWDKTLTIPLSKSSTFKSIEFSLSLSTEQMANRVLIQSRAGDYELGEGSDLTAFSVDNGKPLLDLWHNVGQELGSVAELEPHAIARLNDVKEPKGSASYSVVGEPAEWLAHLGKKIIFVGEAGTEAEGYSTTVRLTGVNFSLDSKIIRLDLMLPATRYPRLPSDTSKFKQQNPLAGMSTTPISGGGISGPAGTPSNFVPGKFVPPSKIVKDTAGPVVPMPDGNEQRKIALGSYHALGIGSSGGLFSWGGNYSGQLGRDTAPDSKSHTPAQIGTDTDWIAVYAANDDSWALKSNGTLWAWGSNNLGQLGLGHTSPVQFPTQIMDNVKSVWNKVIFGIHIIKNDGTLWATGYNVSSQLGFYSDSVIISTFTQVTTKNDWVKLEHNNSDATGYVLGLDTSGKLWEWGYYAGSSPTLIDTNVIFKDVSVSACYNNGQFLWYAAAVSTTGELYTWGNGYHDETGQFTILRYPTLYGGSAGVVHSLLYCGTFEHRPGWLIMFIKDNGELWAFGQGNSGSVLGNTIIPVNYGVETGFNWKESYLVRSNKNSLFAVIKGGELWVGGANYSGELGRGDKLSTTPFFYRIGTDSTWMRAQTGQGNGSGYSALAVLDNNMFGTGWNQEGQLGLENYTNVTAWTIQPSSDPNI